MIELLRKVKSLGLDLFHDVVTVPGGCDGELNLGWQLVWAVAILVYDKKPSVGLDGPPQALHCCLRVVQVVIRIEDNCSVEPFCGQLRSALRAEHWMHVPPAWTTMRSRTLSRNSGLILTAKIVPRI